MKSARRKRYLLIASAAVLLVLLAQPAPAATKNWVGPKGNTLWTNANNWSSAGQPVSGDEANLLSTSNKTAVYDTTLNPLLADMTIDATGGGTFTLSQSANALTIQFGVFIGESGKGQVVQSGGTHADSALILGGNFGSSGTYTLSGGASLSSSSNQVIGFNGTGLFNQTGGNNTVGNALILGQNASGVGTYNLSGGLLQANIETVGGFGTGTFTQSINSTNIVSGQLNIGVLSAGPIKGSGTYTMKGGYLQTFGENVGDNGIGTFTQSGGTHQIINVLLLGGSTTGNGTFNLLAGSLSAANEYVGFGGTGQFTQSGGSNTVSTKLAIGSNPGSNGTYTLNAGSLSLPNFNGEIIGDGGTGTFTQNGGTHTTRTLSMGSGGTGVYNLNGGTLSTVFENLGISGVTTFNQSGGSNTCTGQFALGEPISAAGTYNLKSGSLTVGNEFISGAGGSGIFNQTGGTHTVKGILFLAVHPGDSGIYNLKGGTLSAPGTSINIGAPSGSGAGGTFNVMNTTTTVTGDVNNSGTVKTTNANVTWNGLFTNNGAYISDPSTQTFNKDLSVGSGGYLVGGSQDLFVIKNDFINHSANQDQWNTVLSSLKFATGADNSHVFSIDGQGPTVVNNFAWYSLNITGQTLHLIDGNGTPNGDQWLQVLLGAKFTGTTLTNIFNDDPTNVLNLYYDKNLAANAYLGGKNYTITGGLGGMLIAHTPVPPSVLLLGSGLLGLGALGWRRKRLKA